MSIRLCSAVLLTVSIVFAQDAKQVIDQALKSLGDVKSVQFTGSGALFTVGQNVSPAKPWPRVEIKSFTTTFDYEKEASRTDGVAAAGPAPTQFLSGAYAWQGGANVTPASSAVTASRQLLLWMTPHGFFKGALASNAAAKKHKIAGQPVTLVTYTKGKHPITGTINSDNVLTRVESRLDNPVLGDMLVEMEYAGYRDFGGVRFPARFVQKQGGYPSFDFNVTGAKANVGLDLTPPASVREAVPPQIKVASEKLGDGVWYITGGSHHSALIEFRDHLAVIEAPLSEERSLAVIAEVKKLVPGKPIRYLVSTHHHFDHSGGLRAYIAEGSTIVAHRVNKAFYEQVAKAPRTMNPDRQARERKRAKILPVDARRVLTDGARTVELHHIQGSPHNEGILMAYLPKDKILVEVDVYTPLAPNAAPPATPNPSTVNLLENVERLKLDVARIAPLHGRLATIAELKKTAGR